MTHSTKSSKSFQNKAHRNQSSWCMHRLNTFSKAFTNGCFEMTGAQTDRHVYFSLFAFLSSYPLSNVQPAGQADSGSVLQGALRQWRRSSQQPRGRRSRESRGGGGPAVQTEGVPPALLPALAAACLRALLPHRLGVQAATGPHHLRQPTAAQVEQQLMLKQC